MKLLLKTLYVALMALMVTSCYRDNEGSEDFDKPLVIEITPDPGTTIARALGTTYDFQLAVKSEMPIKGVDVAVTYRLDSDNSIAFAQNYTTTTTLPAILITHIPFNEVGTVTVTVTSKSMPSNKAIKTFKLVRK